MISVNPQLQKRPIKNLGLKLTEVKDFASAASYQLTRKRRKALARDNHQRWIVYVFFDRG
ncbi:hypothetical protein AAIM60_13090 [Pseudomonas lijiangensis]|uniref:hypothetical protein n=1 Tax=Pseudomonas lijiangensis TaxID=2995658 RepID=UPI0031B9B7D2